MVKINVVLLALILLGAGVSVAWANPPDFDKTMLTSAGLDGNPYTDDIIAGELSATPAAKKVLVQARMMMANGEIIKGGCWDYLNEAWRRAGYPEKKRQVIHQGKYKVPPYANVDNIQAGDWLYYVNYSYREIEHSGMFVGWLDKENNIGLIFSYAGENRPEPARYRPYDLSGVYRITRAVD